MLAGQLSRELRQLDEIATVAENRQASGNHMEVLQSLLGFRGALTHYPKYFELLLESALELHETSLGMELVRVLFPHMANGDSERFFELNRATVKYYKTTHHFLVIIWMVG